jgi:S-adenosylmethionine:tRNA ribosyltransferase-isomerase
VKLPAGGEATILAPYAGGGRLWLARLSLPEEHGRYLQRHGRPIRYRYVPRPWPLSAYENVYALEPGSAEMPSAGRPFTPELITRLVARGVLVAPITLHTGVSSPERHERPYPEPYRVPAETARLVNAVHGWGGRVIGVGTTVVRALESAAAADGTVGAAAGWTSLVVTPERGVAVVDGLVTGWHEPEASHLDMLRAVAGEDLLARSYDAALAAGYLWHEFGDSHLVLP